MLNIQTALMRDARTGNVRSLTLYADCPKSAQVLDMLSRALQSGGNSAVIVVREDDEGGLVSIGLGDEDMVRVVAGMLNRGY